MGGKMSGEFPWEITAGLMTHSQLTKKERKKSFIGLVRGSKTLLRGKP